jgi:hypothetical protein
MGGVAEWFAADGIAAQRRGPLTLGHQQQGFEGNVNFSSEFHFLSFERGWIGNNPYFASLSMTNFEGLDSILFLWDFGHFAALPKKSCSPPIL